MAVGKQSDTGTVGWLKDTFKTLVYAGLIAIAFRTVLIEPFNIPSGSMIPTLLVGDYLFVSKYSYGYSRHSLPLSPPLFKGRIFGSEPQRGDVVVFKLPTDNKTDYIKRIVGLPGDTIQVVNGILHVNGEPVVRVRVAGDANTPTGATTYRETLPGGRQHLIVEMSDTERDDNTDLYRVPAGYYFAMGDNRDNSMDSRFQHEVGFVPAENLVGRAEFIFFSHDGTARWWEVWNWPEAIRFDRIFQAVN